MIDRLDKAKLKQIPFALANALTITAGQSKDALEHEIRDVFDRPTNRIQKSPKFSRTSKKGPFYVYVFLSEDSDKGVAPKNILRAHVYGGQRAQKGHERGLAKIGAFGDSGDGYTRPADRSGVRLNQYGNMAASKYQQILSRLKAFDTAGSDQNESTRSKARNRNKNRAQYFVAEGDRFTAVWERYGSTQGTRTARVSDIRSKKERKVSYKTRQILPRKRRPVLVFLKKAQYEDRFDIQFVVQSTFNKNMSKNFGFALARAIKTAK